MSWRRKLELADDIRREIEQEEAAPGTPVPELTDENTEKASNFAEIFLKFKPTDYQRKLLDETKKRIIVIWPRQSGKSTTLAARMIWYAATHERTLSLIVAPGLRQSMILMDRIQAFLMGMAKPVRRKLISKMQRTVIWFKKGSQIVALPNSPNLLRGYTAHQVLCFPARTWVLLANGIKIPICQVKPGQYVLSWNPRKSKVEAREVIRTFIRKFHGSLIRIVHEFGEVQCTPNHQFYTPLGKISAERLCVGDQLIHWSGSIASRQASHSHARAAPLWWPSWRFLRVKSPTPSKKLFSSDSTLCQTSRIRAVQVLINREFCEDTTKTRGESWMGYGSRSILNMRLPLLHSGACGVLQERSEDTDSGVALKDNAPARASSVVHGRWKLERNQRNGCNQHPCVHGGGARVAQGLAVQDMGNYTNRKAGRPRKGLFSCVFSRGTRQTLRFSETLHSSHHDIQSQHCSSAVAYMPCLPPDIHTKTKCVWNCEGSPVEPLLFEEMPRSGGIEASIQSATHIMQDLHPNLHPSYWQSSHMRSTMPTGIPFDEKKGMESSLQATKEVEVFNLEVDGNHNYFANGLLVANCDEAAFFRDDELVFFNVLFPMLQTTDGTLIVSSTPWGKDSVFYRFAQNPDFSKHKINYEDVIKAKLATREFIEEMRRELPSERFRREFEAEFVEDEMAYLAQDLITRCIDPDSQLIPDAIFGF